MALRKFIILQDRLPSHSLMKSSLMECLLHIFDMRKGPKIRGKEPKSGGKVQKSVEDQKIYLIRLSGLHEKESKKQLERAVKKRSNVFSQLRLFLTKIDAFRRTRTFSAARLSCYHLLCSLQRISEIYTRLYTNIGIILSVDLTRIPR